MLATRRQTQLLAGIRAKAQNPIRQPPGIQQFARLREAVGGFNIRVARILLVETAEGGFKSPGIGWLKWFGHSGVLCQMRRVRKADSLRGMLGHVAAAFQAASEPRLPAWRTPHSFELVGELSGGWKPPELAGRMPAAT